MMRIIHVLAGHDELTVTHDHRQLAFPCPRCGRMIPSIPGARCTDCGARVDSVQDTYPQKKPKPKSKLPQPAMNHEREGMLGCLYGLYLRSRGFDPAVALKLVQEKYPNLVR
jgi:predicted amidophosphoribosyltransferase